MNFYKIRHISIGTICALVLSVIFSCEHRPLSDAYNGYYLRIYIDESIKNVTCGFYDNNREKPEYERPKVLRVMLTDPHTDKIVAERYLQSAGEDERGYYIDGIISVQAGEYNLMAYNFDTEKIRLENDHLFYGIKAYTQPISDSYHKYFPDLYNSLNVPDVRYEPDHLFIATCEPVKVSRSTNTDTLRTSSGDWFSAVSIVRSYYLQVRIKGLEYVTSAVSLLGGMASSVTLCNREILDDTPINIFFGMNYTDVMRSADSECSTAVLYTTFNTFGKLPDKQSIYKLYFEFTKTDGTSQVETIDITSMFGKPPVSDKQWILLEREIAIVPPEGGGMNPGVDDWKDIWTDIQL